MERLKVGAGDPYDPIEASLHIGRYAISLPFAAGRRVLDVACGEGYGSQLLTDHGATEVVGVDISPDAIEKARTTFANDRLRFETGACESLAQLLPKAHFDLVVSLETIEHVTDPEAFLRSLRQVATRDAIFVLTCPNDYWYYGDKEGNPYHLRRLTFDQFRSLTTKFLGNNVQWLLGSAALGFAAVPVNEDLPSYPAQSKYTQVSEPVLTLRLASGDAGPSISNAGYFIGIWNAPHLADGAGAYHAVSMDYYSKMMWARTSTEQLAALRAEVTDLRTKHATLTVDLNTIRLERDMKAFALANEIREREILGVQATALRRENEIVSSQLTTLRTMRDDAERQRLELQVLLNNEREIMVAEVAALGVERDTVRTSLDWHIARVVSLDEALNWHVARVASLDEALSAQLVRVKKLETEGSRQFIRRKLSRIAVAWPPLGRLISRLRRNSNAQGEKN